MPIKPPPDRDKEDRLRGNVQRDGVQAGRACCETIKRIASSNSPEMQVTAVAKVATSAMERHCRQMEWTASNDNDKLVHSTPCTQRADMP